MFKSYRKLKITTMGSAFLSCALVLTACNASEPAAKTADVSKSAAVVKKAATATVVSNSGSSRTYANGKNVIDGGVSYPVKDSKTGPYRVTTQDIKDFKFGRTPTKNEIAAWDIDIMPDGTGLPEGSGTVEDGDEIYEAKCVACHGDFGSGGGGFPSLAKGNAAEGQKTLKNQRTGPDMDGPIRVFGTYWPYASTLWWYIKTGMPHTAPMSLSDDDVYALCAYIISINEIEIDGVELDDEYELNREKFLKIVMPNKDGFVPDINDKDGLENVRKFYSEAKNFGGNKSRCMKDCFEGEAKVQGILIPISDFKPPLNNVKDLPKESASAGATKGKKTYEAACSMCHGNDAMGAPVFGNKGDWARVTKQDMKTVYEHALKGFNGMPAKGGQTSLSDETVKEAVDYMISKSK